MIKKPVSKKIIASVTALFTMVVMCGMPAFAFASGSGVTKEETVYVVTDSTGTQTDVVVSDHLVNKDENKTISDETTLSDIENVKGEETFNQKGNSLTWDAEGSSIYYQGKTDEEVPVTMDVTYRLNDEVVTGPELQGQSGKVEIKIDYENNAVYDGTTVPFIVMTGLVVTDESFKNIKISKGKVIDDGDKLLVVGMAAPGLAQTIGVGESELGIGSSVTITGDADKFAVEDMMTIVTNAFFEDIDTGGIGNLDYDDEIAALDKGSKALVEGSAKLCDGLDTLSGKMPGLKRGVGDLKKGADKLNAGTQDAQKGAAGIYEGIGELCAELPGMLSSMVENLSTMESGVETLVASLEGVKAALKGYMKALNDAKAQQQNVIDYLESLQGVYDDLSPAEKAIVKAKLGPDFENKMNSAITDAYTVKGTMDAVANGSGSGENANPGLAGIIAGLGSTEEPGNTIIYKLSKLGSGLKDMKDGIVDKSGDLNTGLGELLNGSKSLSEGEDQLAIGAQALANGMESLQDKSGSLIDGVNKLDKGSLEISQGMSKLYKEGIKKIVDLYNNDLKGTLNSVDGLLDAGKGYKTFTRLPAGMDGNVKFIYKTDMTE